MESKPPTHKTYAEMIGSLGNAWKGKKTTVKTSNVEVKIEDDIDTIHSKV